MCHRIYPNISAKSQRHGTHSATQAAETAARAAPRSLLKQQITDRIRYAISIQMRRWNQLATITARRRREKSPDRYFQEFQQLLKTWQQLCCQCARIKAYSWSIVYAKRDLPQVTCIILLHRAASAERTAAVATAVESAFEDIANMTVVVTFSKKVFRSIVCGRLNTQGLP